MVHWIHLAEREGPVAVFDEHDNEFYFSVICWSSWLADMMLPSQETVPARDTAVGIATACGLDVPGMNPGEDEIPHRPDRPWGPPSVLYKEYRVSPAVRRQSRGVDHTHRQPSRLKKK
jgi:hypothetical protein